MPRRSNNKPRSRGRRSSRTNETASTVRWGTLTRMAAPANASVVRRVSYLNSFSTNAAGLGFLAGSSTNMRSNGFEWGDLAALYTLYRILGVKITLTGGFPQAATSLPTSLSTALFGTDRSGVLSTPTTQALMVVLDQFRMFNLDYSMSKPITYSAKALNFDDQDFVPTSTNATTFIPYCCITGSFSTTNAATYVIEWFVEFRGAQ